MFCGVRRIGYSISMLGRSDPDVMECWERSFVFYWGVSIQYLAPALLWFVLVFNLQLDVSERYGDYSNRMQVTGFLVPVIGVVVIGHSFGATWLVVALRRAPVAMSPEEGGAGEVVRGHLERGGTAFGLTSTVVALQSKTNILNFTTSSLTFLM